MVIPFVQNPRPRKQGATGNLSKPRIPASEPIPLVGNTDPWSWLLAASLQIDLWRLARFNELMAQHDMPVHLGRIFRDPVYAFERLSLAHGVGNPELKTLALEMFEQYLTLQQRRRAGGALASPLSEH
jgi:hypothetical protein